MVQELANLGFLNSKTSLAHCCWISDRDIGIIRDHDSTAVHNAVSNLRLGSGIMPVLKARENGANVSFGCDGSASNDGQNLLEAIKFGSFLHNITDPDYKKWITPSQAVDMAASGGAKGVGMSHELGRIVPNFLADFVLYDLDHHTSSLPRTDPLGALLWGRPSQKVVEQVFINGIQVVDNGKVLGASEKWLLHSLQKLRKEWILVPKPSPLLQQMEAPYRKALL
eukprot:TRINITY_DN13473_c0_g1_i1.p1 TRINITY_DN13473_c0_g1~~TRINITY_DN13473_c0_g1_i1.p1  ORF type:complete len:225 (+),score=28.49 TRINITY_DN13473_c0_g1_i1:205-879(+)